MRLLGDDLKVVILGFNPRICKRCDACINEAIRDGLVFQSTHL